MTVATPVSLMRPELAQILVDRRKHRFKRGVSALAGLSGIILALYLAGIFDIARYRDAHHTIATLIADALPPDFSRWRTWGRPLVETLAMSIAGTAIACLIAFPLSTVAARNTGSPWIGRFVRLILNTFRSIPEVVWGIACVAAVGFGPLPGALALAFHSTGMLGEFYAEMLEHVDPAPGDALRSQGLSWLGVMRLGVLPQILPRVVDVSLYRWEHNVRAAIVMGVIGAGGIGLEIMTAFQLFEYREALALIIVLLGLVTAINAIGGRVRARFLHH